MRMNSRLHSSCSPTLRVRQEARGSMDANVSGKATEWRVFCAQAKHASKQQRVNTITMFTAQLALLIPGASIVDGQVIDGDAAESWRELAEL
eukprot:4381168-Pleurochrysis_carterae.AAC.1